MQTREKPDVSERIGMILHKCSGIGHFLLAFILADACLMDSIRPFGLCYGLTLEEKDRLWGTGGAFLGSLMICGGEGGMLYGAAAIVALTADTFLLRESRVRELFLPLLVSGIITLIKMPFALSAGMGAVGLLLLECLLTALACYCLLLPQAGTEGTVRGAVLWIMTVSAFADLRLLQLLSPACSAAILLTMSVTFGSLQTGDARRPELTGGAFGLVIGAFLDMSCASGPFYAAVFGLAAVLTALLPARSRIAFTIAFLLSGLCALLWSLEDPRAIGCIYDLFIAASLFLLLPERWAVLTVPRGSTAAEPLFFQTGEGYALRLRGLGSALSALARSIGESMEGEEDMTVVFDRAAAEVCRSCTMAGLCWVDDYVSTVDGFNGLGDVLRRKGHAAPEELRGVLAARCSRKNALCAAVNREYMSLLRRRAEQRDRRRQNELLRAQYAGIGAAAEGLALSARGDYVHKPLAEKQVAAILAAYRRGLHTEVWRGSGRLHIAIGPFEPETEWAEEEAFIRSVEGALSCRLLPAERVCGKSGEQYLYKERETLAVTLSAAVRRKPGEEICGDAYAFFHTEDGRAVVLLSDGMGTGKEAARLSRSTVDLIAAFVRSGCTVHESAGAVVPFLQARRGNGFATLDLLEIDLFTGGARLIKCGAADSYLAEHGQVRTLSVPSLPPGADPGGSTELQGIDLMLRPGCRIIMASDGAELDDTELLRRPDLRAGQVVEACGRDSRDDMTVLVLTVEANEERREKCGQGNVETGSHPASGR